MKRWIEGKMKAVVATAVIAMVAAPALADCGGALTTFDSGTLEGWLSSANGGSGSTTVQMHNGSNAAYVQQTGGITRALSCDYVYDGSSTLSFDLHAIANAGANTNAYSGLLISFLTSLGSSLGSMGIYNTTFASLLGPRDIQVDTSQHHYASLMSDYAAQAGVSNPSNIVKISLSLVAYAQTTNLIPSSSSQAWLDNVAITPVPEPAHAWLMLAGLLATSAFIRRRRVR